MRSLYETELRTLKQLEADAKNNPLGREYSTYTGPDEHTQCSYR